MKTYTLKIEVQRSDLNADIDHTPYSRIVCEYESYTGRHIREFIHTSDDICSVDDPITIEIIEKVILPSMKDKVKPCP